MKKYVTYLKESRIEKIENKFSGIVEDDIIQYFKDNDPTQNKSYFEWLCDRYSKSNKEPSILIKMVTKYNNIKNKLEQKDKQINRIKSVEELETILNRNNDWSKLNDYDVDILYQSVEWEVFIPYTEEVSGKYGDKAWCTVYKPSEHFRNRFGHKGALIYFMNKLDSDLNFALQQTDKNEYEIWDSNNYQIKSDTLNNLFNDIKSYVGDNELVKNWNDIKIPKAEETIKEYSSVLKKELKSKDIKDLVDEYDDQLLVSMNKSEQYYKDLDSLSKSHISDKLKLDSLFDKVTPKVKEFLQKYIDWEKFTIEVLKTKNL